MIDYWKQNKFPILMALFSVVLYSAFSYDLIRTDFIKLITLYGALFFFCYKLIQLKKNDFRFILIIGILFRLVFIVAIPNLSQDFYRFIWDGRLLLQGINPYLHLPNDLVTDLSLNLTQKQELFNGMGELSAKHYSNYPPLSQFYFSLSAFIGGKGILGPVIFMRIAIVLADIGILYLGRKVLKLLKMPQHNIFWYFLNPLIIIELTGNLHFESLMFFLFIWSLYLLIKNKWWQSALIMALSISVKLVPLLFLPLLLKRLGWKKSFFYYTIILLVNLILFLPFLSPGLISNYTETVGLWFTNFEFNASIFNIVKEVGYYFSGKNLIKTIGKFSPLIVISTILLFTFLRKNQIPKQLILSMLFVLSLYYFTSTTVHPWYLSFLLLLSVFTRFKYVIAWSGLVVLSYYAYSNISFKENPWILLLEYLPVYGYLFYELFKIRELKPKYS